MCNNTHNMLFPLAFSRYFVDTRFLLKINHKLVGPYDILLRYCDVDSGYAVRTDRLFLTHPKFINQYSMHTVS